MSWINDYQPPSTPALHFGASVVLPEAELYGPTPYDINFAYPLHEETLQSDRVKLVPFIPSVHAETYWRHVGDRKREIFRYYPFIFGTLEETLSFFERFIRRDPHVVLFAVIDKTRPDAEHPEWGGSLAGLLTTFDTSVANLVTEIGYVVVFPEFRGTHVAKHMVGVLLRYLLQLPSQSPPGIGFRRVQWQAHPDNAPSLGLARRMGFKVEGRKTWAWALPDELAEMGRAGRAGDPVGGLPGRDSICLSLCWDEWEGGVREQVEAILR
ncbi:acyl-CoA N-acyltransferase [Lentinus tigrinus ALCF2SS1-7]|uniref:Acyl-CoA N-acyltransferase n=1 Tax=Lentinus tigrinus ALCF2SS1-6 TaxID=1328759 RepID=A0A5C2RVZ6_9APHY|nr:acyl-CoA N-acyltransferase [Lentinus tigrinus ALCF2SS1-6]RPD70149.1 acyl-CoA N-acyltransferase [Lentinus tigrinus ALCF2SS1-7]